MKSINQLGSDLFLFLNIKHSKGEVVWLDRGNKLYALIKDVVLRNLGSDYLVINTPSFYNADLFERSGHIGHYKNNMFGFEDKYLKPMSCPAHIEVYKTLYRHLKTCKLFEFGKVFRNEAEGAIRTLTRCLSFVQDDAHIFTDYEDIAHEINILLKEIDNLYKYFDLDYEYVISESTTFTECNNILKNVLKDTNYTIDKSGAAFYGPKIDIFITTDVNKYQLGTIQLDFQTLERFNIKNKFLIHRALLGSIERFIGIYLEIYQGYFPFAIEKAPIFILNVEVDTSLPFFNDKKVHYSTDEVKYYKELKVPKMYFIGQNEVKMEEIRVEVYEPKSGKYNPQNIKQKY